MRACSGVRVYGIESAEFDSCAIVREVKEQY